MNLQRPLSVGILVFDAVEVLNFAGPYEVFTTDGLPLDTGILSP
jgi:hypothetical protein